MRRRRMQPRHGCRRSFHNGHNLVSDEIQYGLSPSEIPDRRLPWLVMFIFTDYPGRSITKSFLLCDSQGVHYWVEYPEPKPRPMNFRRHGLNKGRVFQALLTLLKVSTSAAVTYRYLVFKPGLNKKPLSAHRKKPDRGSRRKCCVYSRFSAFVHQLLRSQITILSDRIDFLFYF